ncbi:MAG TPA: 4-(cytidine 5'-diphospho)-2-C-methyl-D-erythritol kinase [Flavobacteriales bacterium]|nr:4-(cytidine 5'-diphospho)-2-C-methyl-D-erythritol kinase [Flavobacteriales bacterium]
MVVFPKAKINLGLNVVRKRPDGFHDIESVLLPIPLCDALEAVADEHVASGCLEFTRTGLPIDGDPMQDLVVKAHALVAAHRPLPGVRMHLHKRIPAGGGLGGGSSDGAHALMLLDRLFGLSLTRTELLTMAASLGSDCPFFLHDGAQMAQGRGEVLHPVDLDLHGYWLYLVNPGIHVSTKDVFAMATPTGQPSAMVDVLQRTPLKEWRIEAPNTLEPAVCRTHPEIGRLLEQLVESGADHAAMSGSGSTVFGLFRTRPVRLDWPASYRSWILPLG